MKYILTDEDIEKITNHIVKKIQDKFTKKGLCCEVIATGEALKQMIPFHIKKHAEKTDNEKIGAGDFYEDYRGFPMLCTKSDYFDDILMGICLLDWLPGNCSPKHCGVKKLTPQEALELYIDMKDAKIAD